MDSSDITTNDIADGPSAQMDPASLSTALPAFSASAMFDAQLAYSLAYKALASELGSTGQVLRERMQVHRLNPTRDAKTILSIGTLEILPEEMRLQVYSHVTLPDFKQHYEFTDKSINLLASSSPVPSIFKVSKALSEELLLSMYAIQPCEITITDSFMATNFLLFNYVDDDQLMSFDIEEPTPKPKPAPKSMTKPEFLDQYPGFGARDEDEHTKRIRAIEAKFASTQAVQPENTNNVSTPLTTPTLPDPNQPTYSEAATSPLLNLTRRMLNVPHCRELVIKIQIPSPRSGARFADTRNSMKRLVAMFNSENRLELPPIRVTFNTNRYFAKQMYVYNDLALLVGPLYELRNVRRLIIDQPLRVSARWRKKVADDAQQIQVAMEKKPSPYLVAQQLLLDFKIKILSRLRNYPGQAASFQAALSTNDLKALVGEAMSLVYAFVALGKEEPDWIWQFCKKFERRESVERGDLKEEIEDLWGVDWVEKANQWMAGFRTRENPLYGEIE